MKKFDLTIIFNEKRPLSWSAIASFEWNPKQWYEKYVLKEYPEITPELKFGSWVDKKIQDDPTFLPLLVRYPEEQLKMSGVFNGVPLIGYADAWDVGKLCLRDYKTGRKPWDKKRADETGQLTLYAFMLYLEHKIKPEDLDLYIDWLPTHIKDGKICFIEEDHKILKPKTFRTKRTMHQVLTFGQRIKDTWVKMEDYAGSHSNHIPSSKVKISKFLR